jgi:hypothetical protein
MPGGETGYLARMTANETVTFEVIAERPKRRARGRLAIALGLAGAGAAAAAASRRRSHRRASESGPAELGFMYAMHNAMRRDLSRLESAVSLLAGAPAAPETVAGFEQLRKELLVHHEAEDDDLWPRLRPRLDQQSDLADVDAMVEEHARIPAALDAVASALRGEGDAPAAVSTLNTIVRAHLEHEERDVLPLVRQHLSDADWHEFLRTERSKQPPRDRVAFLTWVLDSASPADESVVLHELPPPGRIVYRRVLRPRYERRHLWSAAGTPRSA